MKPIKSLKNYIIFPAIIIVAALGMSGFIDPYLAYVATSWIIFGLLGMSLDVVWGRGGLLSLGQTAFYSLDGYVGSVIALNMAPLTGNSLIWSLPFGTFFDAIFAVFLGAIIFFARMGLFWCQFMYWWVDWELLQDHSSEL